MSFDTLRVKIGRRPITIVEIDLDFCQNAYGTSSCTAAVGTTGMSKCYNGFKSCQDQANYNLGTKTYSFCTNNTFLPIGLNIFPCITAIDVSPSILVPEDFSVSAAVTVTAQDFPHHDRGVDPYVQERSYDPMAQGSFFGKLRARNPYMNNRVMRVKTGYVDEDRNLYTQTRTYLIDHIDGPDASGQVQLVGKDPLRYTDDDKYQVPPASSGILAMDLVIDAVDGATMAKGATAGYPSSGVVRIDDELIAYATIVNDALTGLTRGYAGTVADDHDATAKVQLCVEYNNESPESIIYDLLVNYADIDPSYIALADWSAEVATWLQAWKSSVILSDPTSVRDIIKEILQATAMSLWWDEEAARIRLQVVVPYLIKQDVIVLDEQLNILQGSAQVEDEEEQRVSRVITYIKLASPIDDLDTKSFQSISIQIDTDEESDSAYGTPQNLQILSRWTPSEAYASAIGNRILNRRRETPRQITLQVDAKDICKTGDLRDVESRLMQDFDGTPMLNRFLVTQITETEPGTTYEVVMIQVAPRGGKRVALIAPNTVDSWTMASDEDRRNYMFISNDNGFMSDGIQGPTLS